MRHMRNDAIRGIVCAAIMLCCAKGLWAVEFAGGTGEPNDPYQIATAEQLIGMGSDLSLRTKHFILTASIDLSGTTWSSPVISSFLGRFDGNGFAIRGLTARGTGSVGLFGEIERLGRVVNLRVLDVDLQAAGVVGALAAYNDGAVYGCSSSGSVVAAGYDGGGLVGSNSGIVVGSSSTAEVMGYSRVGGLVGYNQYGILRNCRSEAVVFGDTGVGGLVGDNAGSVSACCSDSNVMAATDCGGLVGQTSGRIFACQSTGTVVGSSSMGGLVGYCEGEISFCCSTAVVTDQTLPFYTSVGGLVGQVFFTFADAVMDSYFLAPADGGGPDNEIGTPLTTTQMTREASFAGWDFWGTGADGDADCWFMPEGSAPVLAWQTESTGLKLIPWVTGMTLDQARATLVAAGFVPGDLSYDFHRDYTAGLVIHAGSGEIAPIGETIDWVVSTGTAYDWADNPGDGTAENPYQIGTAGQLESLGDHPELLDKQFVLVADVDMAGRTYSTALVASGTYDSTDSFQGTPFTGVFDGQGHAIRNLTFQAAYRQCMGLFGMVAEAGRISGVHMADTIIMISATGHATRGSVSTCVGILVGGNYGTITDCSAVRGVMTGSYISEGLVGVNYGSLVDCYADGIAIGCSLSVR